MHKADMHRRKRTFSHTLFILTASMVTQGTLDKKEKRQKFLVSSIFPLNMCVSLQLTFLALM